MFDQKVLGLGEESQMQDKAIRLKNKR